MIVPCKGCKDRCVEPNCHTACRKYQLYQAACRIARQRKADRVVCDANEIEAKVRMIKKSRRKGR